MQTHRNTTNRLSAAAACFALAAAAAPVYADLSADQTPFSSYRGMWLDRFDYSSAASITTAMTRAQALGITDMMFQVRGQADAYYFLNDGVETYPAGKGISASYDPLQIAITEAHNRGIKLHAWVNMMPLWNATQTSSNPFTYTPNPPAGHLALTHDEYWVRGSNTSVDPAGNRLEFPGGGTTGYVIVNPTRDDVQAHLNNVIKTIARNYAIDGIHMDYIRLYADNTGSSNPLEFPADPETVARFQIDYPGQKPDGTGSGGTSTQQIANFKAWCAARITKLVGDVRTTMNQYRPGAQLTAAVWRDSSIGLNAYQQDWATWVDQGLLDAAMPMIYRKGFGTTVTANQDTDSGDLYRLNVTSGLNLRGNAGVMVGMGTYMQDNAATAYNNVMAQLNYAKSQGANGIQIFDYGTLYNGTAAQNETLRALTDFFTANRIAPPPTSITNFDADEGYFPTSITFSGSNQNVASGSADRVTSEAHSGAGSQQIVINKTAGAASFLARHVAGIGAPGDFNSNLQFSSIGSVGFWLKTTTPDLQVSFAGDDAAASSTERGFFKNVIADGQWHKYEWFLDDVSHWDSFAGGDGKMGNIFATDSIQFIGTAASNVIFLDDVFYDAAAVAPNQWVLDANGTWSSAGNWNGPIPNGMGAVANLLRRATTARTITLSAPVTLGSLTIDNSFAYTIGGTGQLTMDVSSGSASINVINRGSHTIAAPFVMADPTNVFVDVGSTLTFSSGFATGGKALTKTGLGEVIISGQQVHSNGSTLNVNEGRVTLNSNAGATPQQRLVVNVNDSAALTLGATQNLIALNLSGNASATLAAGANKVLKTNTLAIGASSKLDLNDNDSIVQATAATRVAVLADVTSWIASARNSIAGRWRGSGITSSTAAGDARGITTVAAILNDDGAGTPIYTIFDGQSVDVNSILLKFTYTGDSDLDGDIDADDYAHIDAGFAGHLSGYANGDYDFSGSINSDDFFIIDRAYSMQSTPLAAISGAIAAVPEPAVLASLAPALLLLRRRRCR